MSTVARIGLCTLVLGLALAGCRLWPAHDALPESPWRHPYYDVDRIKALTLDQLHFQETQRTTVDGVEVVCGTYSGFEQPLALADGSVKTIPWRQGAALFLPPRDRMSPATDKAVLYNGHYIFTDPIKKFPHVSVWGFKFNERWGVSVAKAFGIPVLIHGYEPLVVRDVEGTMYHWLQAIEFERLLGLHITRAEDMPLDGRYLINGWPLAKGDMVSITLLQRLAERERGVHIKEVGSLGISKEGSSHWILGAADDRVAVVAPGGSAIEDWNDVLERWRTDFGADQTRLTSLGFPAEDPLLKAAWRLGDWITTTDAGRKVDQLISPTHWIGAIRSRHILVSHDLGIRKHHDRIWPVMGENPFLERLFREHPSVRDVRVFDGSGLALSDEAGEMGFSLLPSVADLLLNGATTPTTPAVTVEENGRRLRFNASATVAPGGELLLLYAMSADRSLRTNDVEWKTIHMTGDRAGHYQSPWLDPVPADQAITYIVIAREQVQQGELKFWRSAATLPGQHFLLPKLDGRLPSWREPFTLPADYGKNML